MISIDSHPSCASFTCPIEDLVEISTGVYSAMMREIALYLCVPLQCYGSQIPMARHHLVKVVNAMV